MNKFIFTLKVACQIIFTTYQKKRISPKTVKKKAAFTPTHNKATALTTNMN